MAVTYGGAGSATGSYFGYDAVGQVITHRQVTGTTAYSMSYSYNMFGELTSETYPSGRVVNSGYDEAGRPSGVTDGWGTTYDSAYAFAPHGGLTSETFGNGAVITRQYNNALQMKQLKLTFGMSVPTRQNPVSEPITQQQYDYGYGNFNSATGSVDTTTNNGQIGSITSTYRWIDAVGTGVQLRFVGKAVERR